MSKVYSVSFGMSGHVLTFWDEYTHVERWGNSKLLPLDAVKFESEVGSEATFRFHTTFEWAPDEEGEPWESKDPKDGVKERPASYTICMNKVDWVRTIHRTKEEIHEVN